jgi:hypothetical protein
MARKTDINDERNVSFVPRENVVKHKPGLDLAAQEGKTEAGNHQFRRSEEKKIPHGSLAERIAKATSKSTKGG